MPDSNPTESAAVEGLPDEVQDTVPGKDVETLEEGARLLPRDHSIAAGSDPAYPVTVHEQVTGESVAERAASETPDFGERRSSADVAADDAIAIDTDGEEGEVGPMGEEAPVDPEDGALHVTEG